MKKTGFTLIELIVVITIIAVLMVVVVVSFTGVTKRTRDGKRMADLEKYRVALELYRQQVGTSYPASLGTLIPDYVPTALADPKGFTYYYEPLSGGYKYQIGATVEDGTNSNSSEFGNCGGVACNYKVLSP